MSEAKPSVKPAISRLENSARAVEAALARRIERYPYFHCVEGPTGPITCIGGRQVINLGSNNYLGLATHPSVINAAQQAVASWGAGVTGSRLLNGNLALHEEMEAKLAAFYGREAALLFPTGYTANLGLLSGLLERSDRVYMDADVHASVIDGVLLSRAKPRRFRHNDPDHLRFLLARDPSPERAVCIIEGVYSMRGDAAPVADIVRVCEEFGTTLVDDEAHGLGTLGPRGAGAADLYGVLNQVDLFTVTFSKTLGSCGGAIVGRRAFIDALKISSRPLLFTASNTPGSIASAMTALDLLSTQPSMVQEVQARAKFFREQLTSRGLQAQPGDGPIITVVVGSDFRVLQAWQMLWNRSLFCNPVLTPAVPKDKGLLRFSIMRTHSEALLVEAAEICATMLPLFQDEWVEEEGHSRAVPLPISDDIAPMPVCGIEEQAGAPIRKNGSAKSVKAVVDSKANDGTAKRRHSLHECKNVDEICERLMQSGIDLSKLVGDLVTRDCKRSILITGSIAEGMGTPESDLDVMVLVDSYRDLIRARDMLNLRTGHSQEVLTYANGVEINIDFMARDRLMPLMASLVALLPSMYDPRDLDHIPFISATDLQFLHRLRTAWVLEGWEIANTWRSEFMVNLLPLYLSVKNYVDGVELLEDSFSMVGEPTGTAILMARMAVEHCISAILAKADFTNQSKKWLLRFCTKMNDGPQRAILQQALELFFPPLTADALEQRVYVLRTQELFAGLRTLLEDDDATAQAIQFLRKEISYIGLDV